MGSLLFCTDYKSSASTRDVAGRLGVAGNSVLTVPLARARTEPLEGVAGGGPAGGRGAPSCEVCHLNQWTCIFKDCNMRCKGSTSRESEPTCSTMRATVCSKAVTRSSFSAVSSNLSSSRCSNTARRVSKFASSRAVIRWLSAPIRTELDSFSRWVSC